MATYYWQAEIPKNANDNPLFYSSWVYISECAYTGPSVQLQNIEDILDNIAIELSNYGLGSFNYTVTDNGNTWLVNATIEVTEESPQCIPLWLHIITEEAYNWGAAWTDTPADAELCTTCQSLTFSYCSEIGFELAFNIPDGMYTVAIEDHQTGVIYNQAIVWEAGVGTWYTSNSGNVFTPYSVYTLTIPGFDNQPVSWTSGGNEYNCARITFTNTTNTNPVE